MKSVDIEWLADDGTPMHADRWHADSKSTMVICLIHGLGEHSGRYQKMAQYYVAHGAEVFAIDLRGHGRSAGQRGHGENFQQLTGDIDGFLRNALANDVDKPLFIYGHSMGGALVIQYALSRRRVFNGVILSSPLFKPAFEPPQWKVRLGRYLQLIWPTLSLSNEVDMTALTRNVAELDRLQQDPLSHNRISAQFGIQLLEQSRQLLSEASRVDFPVLLMHGNADEITCHKASTQFAEHAGQSCCLKIWEGFYHELHHEPEQEEVFDYCLKWMKQTYRAGKSLSSADFL